MEAKLNPYDAEHVIIDITHSYRRKWEDEDKQRRWRADDEELGRKHAGARANPDLLLDGDLPKYFDDLVGPAVAFMTDPSGFAKLGRICREFWTRIEKLEKDIGGKLTDAGLPEGSDYEWPRLSAKVQRTKEFALEDEVREIEDGCTKRVDDCIKRIDKIKANIKDAQRGGRRKPISNEEEKGYETRNNLMRASFYAALTAFVLVEAVVNGVGFEGMGFDPGVALIAAGLLGGFLFWSAHLLGSYIKQSAFYAKDERTKQRVFTALFVIIALSIFLFFTDTRHDYLTQLQQQEAAIDLLGERDVETEPASVPYGPYDYVFMFVNALIYFIGVFVSWLISPKSKELKKVYLEKAKYRRTAESNVRKTREKRKAEMKAELEKLKRELDGWSNEKAELEPQLAESMRFFQQTATNLARAVYRRLGHYINAYQFKAQEQFPGRNVTLEFVKQRLQEEVPSLLDQPQFDSVELPSEGGDHSAGGREPSDSVKTFKES